MSNEQNVLKRNFGGGEISVPEDVLFTAWLEKVTGKSRSPVFEVNLLPFAKSVPRIGEVWPGQGGINGGLARDADGNPYWLIVPPTDIGAFDEVAWGGYGVDVSGAKSEYDGRANTAALLAAGGDYPAARLCSEFSHEGHSDFYLPAKWELAQMRTSVPEHFKKVWHWSSTQYSAGGAWGQGFGGGGQGYAFKYGTARVVPVRRLDF